MSSFVMKVSYMFPGIAVLLTVMSSGCPCCVFSIDILVSPETILLGADQGGEVTVHAAIAYSSVDTNSVTLNGVPALSIGSDARGDLVAKFPEEAIKDLVAPPSVVLTMTGTTLNGQVFTGSEEVTVRYWQ